MTAEEIKALFDEEGKIIERDQIYEEASPNGNDFAVITPEQLDSLKAGKVFYIEGEYGTFLMMSDELPSEVRKREEAKRAAKLEAMRKQVNPGGYVWYWHTKTAPPRRLKVAAVSETSITAGLRTFPVDALGRDIFIEKPESR